MAQGSTPLAHLLTARRLRGLAIVGVSMLIGLVAAVASVSSVSLLPPRFELRDFQRAGAVTHVLVHGERPRITDSRADWSHFDVARRRTDLLLPLTASGPVVGHIARRAGIGAGEIGAVAPIAGQLGEPGSEQRAREILLERRPYRLEIQSRSGSQVIDVYAQAPTVPEAERLADASVPGLRDYFRALAVDAGKPPDRGAVNLVQLGPARGAVLTGGASVKLAALTFLLVFAVALGALRAVIVLRRRRSQGPSVPGAAQGAVASAATGTTVMAAAAPSVTRLRWSSPEPGEGGALALRAPGLPISGRPFATRDGDWPRTTRGLPWLVAAFMATLWLVPFDSIQLDIPSPIDLKIDRIALPFVAGAWALALVMGGRDAPRLRMTWIHLALGAFVVLAFLSVILNAEALNHVLELDTSVKKLPLLLSYLSLFVIMASVVRPGEVAAFLRYTLGLALIVAFAMIVEDRLFYNVFFEWSGKLLPAVFEITDGEAAWDTQGRRLVHGPASHPLVAAAMLSMAMPIAVLGVIHAKTPRRKLLYGLAICVLMVGVLSTERKTGLIGPLAGVLTLLYFRRRELLRLAPMAVVLLLVAIAVAPSTIAPVLDQFKPDQLSGANTVNDRAADYDALRPDVWSHIALGRGYGSYQPIGHRILDSDVLVRIVEMGALGLVAFFLFGASVIACARRMIHSRHPRFATSALAGAAAAVVFLVLATLFDSMGFAQVPYVFLCFAALVAVVAAPKD